MASKNGSDTHVTSAFTVVGTAPPAVHGAEKVTGKAAFGADVALPGTLWCKFARSSVPHARIVKVDVARARAVPGVRAVLVGGDLPNLLWGRAMQDMPVLAGDRVRFVGEKIAAIAAETRQAAEEAAAAVEVEYADLPAVFDPREAMLESAPRIHDDLSVYQGVPKPIPSTPNTHSHVTWKKGDVDAGFRQAEVVFEHEFDTQPVHQGYIEPHACVVTADESGRVRVWASNKMPFRQQGALSPLVDLPIESIDVYATHIGGDFGGKGSLMDIPAAYFLAQKTRRPVRCVMSYLEELTAANPRHGSHIRLKTGLLRDGTIVAHQGGVIWDSGAYAAFKPQPNVNLGGSTALAGSYDIPNVLIESRSVYTNSVPRGHARAPGEPQCRFAIEAHMDMIAAKIGIDPLEFRLKNCLQPGDTTSLGGHLDEVRQEETIRACAERAGWGTSKQGAGKGRGVSIGDRHTGNGFATMRLVASPDGGLTLFTSFPDTGAGSHTVFRQIVAEELGVPPETVRIQTGGTLESPPDSGAGGSRVTHVGGQAALGVARLLKEKLVTGGLDLKALTEPVFVEFKYSGTEAHVTSFSCQIAEVTVDGETGELTVDRVVSAHDVGTIINPLMHQGQIDGGIAHGLGFGVMEDLDLVGGRVGAANLGEYKMPTMADMPELETVLLHSGDGPGPHNAKAIGEGSNTTLAGAIANAVFDACGARITSLPVTSEKIYRALGH